MFQFTGKHKTIFGSLAGIGLLSIIIGFTQGDLTRSWASLLLGNFFFMAIALAATFFLAVQYVAEVGWSVLIKRVLMSFAPYVAFGSIMMILIFIFGHHHLYHWTHEGLTDPNSPEYDKIIAGKSAYLNMPFYTIRLCLYAAIWSGFAFFLRKLSLQEDEVGGLSNYHKSVKYSAIFLVLFGVTSSTSAWDVIMSIDAHWFSTLFGWYNFASYFVSALSMIAIIVIYLKSKGALPQVNASHIHNLGMFMFGFSVFWTYLWFSQFMLYWYADMPEEVVYFMFRQDHYKMFFLGNVFLNFICPFLILMTSDQKRREIAIVFVAIIILIGHWSDFYMMIMPGTVGSHWHIGITEIGTSMFFFGVFMLTLFHTLSKTPLVPKNHPMLDESIHHQY